MRLRIIVYFLATVLVSSLLFSQLRPPFTLATPTASPLPHQISKYPGGISLRFAMVHDVIHERFPVHSREYYQARNASVKTQLAKLESTSPPPAQYWRLLDDLAVGMVHLGDFDSAINLMRQKLDRQTRQGITGLDLYPTYANLGTAMMIDALTRMAKGENAAPLLEQSLTWVRKSIEVNPQAHFGREVWQVSLGEFLLAAQQDPQLLWHYDMIGNSVDNEAYTAHAKYLSVDDRRHSIARALESGNVTPEDRQYLRSRIVRVGGDWTQLTKITIKEKYPFDEPTLGIIGMWRYGAGANRHFSLALAEIMFQVGQRHIAWAAYERTIRLIDPSQPGPDPLETPVTKRCRRRQTDIEATLPSEVVAQLRPAFDAELKKGLDWQHAYQSYEASQIKAGRSIDDPHFYDDFYKQNGEIASDPGDADFTYYLSKTSPAYYLPSAILFGGIVAMASVLLQRFNAWLSRPWAQKPQSGSTESNLPSHL